MDIKEIEKELEKVTSDLSVKQLNFATAYLNNGGNGTQACKTAGYNCSNDNSYASQANRLLKNEKVKKFLKLSKLLNEQLTSIERKDIIRKLEQVITNGSEYPFGQQLEAMKLLINMNGWLAPSKAEIKYDGNLNLIEQFKDLSDEELEEKLNQLSGKLN